MTLAATYFGANGWLLEFDGLRVLVDPWMRGALSFPPGPWLLKGELSQEQPIPEDLDLLLLTQGLADHAHPPTLESLPRSLPVIGSTAAAQVVKRLGFSSVESMKPGETTTRRGLTLRATAGAAVPMVENGYLLEHAAGSLYLEPHGFLDPSLAPRRVDAVITPMVDLGLAGLGSFVKGCSVVPQLIQRFQPSVVLASTSGGDVRFGGALSGLLHMNGTVDETAAQVPKGTRCINPLPGKRYELIQTTTCDEASSGAMA
tara:strand:- start:22 stop:798 length:777 start_codon:yes stop_codon:yes gene_type:complete